MTWAQLDDAFRKGTLARGHGTSGRAAVIGIDAILLSAKKYFKIDLVYYVWE
jgi:hypothetical protein